MTELTNAFVRVIKGQTGNGITVENCVMRLVGHLKQDGRGTYITVDGTGHANLRNGRCKVYVRGTDYTMIDSKTGQEEIAQDVDLDTRTDEEIAAELKETFEIVAEMTQAAASGVVKGVVISGPAGIGKSHTVETTLAECLGDAAALTGELPSYEVIKGHVTPVMLYCMLYRLSNEGSVMVLDDCDVLEDIDALNILKSALDTKKVRKIHWGAASNVLEKEAVPTSFEFRGSVIFLTNTKLDQIKTGKLAPHCEAIVSRVHYLDLQMDTMRERMIHIRNTVDTTNMLDEYGFNKKQKAELMDWLVENVEKIKLVDLRTVLKASDLMKAMPLNWKSRAAKTLFKNSGR